MLIEALLQLKADLEQIGENDRTVATRVVLAELEHLRDRLQPLALPHDVARKLGPRTVRLNAIIDLAPGECPHLDCPYKA